MHESVKVVVLGSGQMGAGMVQVPRRQACLELVGVYGRRAARVGLP